MKHYQLRHFSLDSAVTEEEISTKNDEHRQSRNFNCQEILNFEQGQQEKAKYEQNFTVPTHKVAIKVSDDNRFEDYIQHVYININSRQEMDHFLR